MKVILDTQSLRKPLTGIGNYVFEIAYYFLFHSEIKHLFTIDSTRLGKSLEIVNESDLLALLDKKALAYLMPIFRSCSSLYKILKYVQSILVNRAVSGNNNVVDIYHSTNYFVPSIEMSCQVVLNVHDLSCIKHPELHTKASVDYFNKHFERSCSQADRYIVGSKFIRNELVSTLNIEEKRITVIPYGVGKKFFDINNEKKSDILRKYKLKHHGYILSVSTLEPRKNLNRLITAYISIDKRLRDKYPLVLVGSKGWLCEELCSRIVEVEKTGNLIHLGYVPSADLPYIYSGAIACVFISLYEGFGLPVLEAMASGTLVITSQDSAMSEVAGDCGLYVDPYDVSGITVTIVEVMKNSGQYSQNIKLGRQRAKDFSWDNTGKETVALYRSMVNTKGGTS